jgi:hypothetical protein
MNLKVMSNNKVNKLSTIFYLCPEHLVFRKSANIVQTLSNIHIMHLISYMNGITDQLDQLWINFQRYLIYSHVRKGRNTVHFS